MTSRVITLYSAETPTQIGDQPFIETSVSLVDRIVITTTIKEGAEIYEAQEILYTNVIKCYEISYKGIPWQVLDFGVYSAPLRTWYFDTSPLTISLGYTQEYKNNGYETGTYLDPINLESNLLDFGTFLKPGASFETGSYLDTVDASAYALTEPQLGTSPVNEASPYQGILTFAVKYADYPFVLAPRVGQ